jgi:hypothetical protein
VVSRKFQAIAYYALGNRTKSSQPIIAPPGNAEAVKKLGQAPSRPLIFQGFRCFRSEPVPFFHSLAALSAGEGDEHIVAAVRAADAGEAEVQVAAAEELAGDVANDRPP